MFLVCLVNYVYLSCTYLTIILGPIFHDLHIYNHWSHLRLHDFTGTSMQMVCSFVFRLKSRAIHPLKFIEWRCDKDIKMWMAVNHLKLIGNNNYYCNSRCMEYQKMPSNCSNVCRTSLYVSSRVPQSSTPKR